ncbi:MAG TPA: 6-bladed beta-propeller [Hyphomicrobiales bacterium]|nr:6-bladed beta-propeller [Hyphomicrobiales bacterium]
MNVRSLLVSLVLLCGLSSSGLLLAQDNGAFEVDAEWAGGVWDGSTSWISADRQGRVVVLVRDAPHFRVFTREGEFVRAWGEEGLFKTAHSLTIDGQGDYWVTDSTDHAVYKFSPDGTLLLTLGKPGEAGDNEDHERFNQVNHVAITPAGDIYVSDGYQNARVVQFDKDGRYLRSIGLGKGSGAGQLQVPHGVAVDSRGRILVNDSDNQRVSVFDRDGVFVESWPYPSRGGIEVLPDDTVYVSDVNAGIVNILKDGQLLDSVQADRAHGLGVDSDGTIYVSGASRMTVMKITRR